MKTLFTFIITLISITIGLAQQGINYKALIKDDHGTIIANQQITVQFKFLQGQTKSVMYTEIHKVTTDNKGIIIISIGEGLPVNGDFSHIDWSKTEHYLHTQIDTGNGLKDAGITSFNAVPYAFQAQTANKAMNVTGLEAINEGNGVGWRLIGRNPNNYGAIGFEAIDLSSSSYTSTNGSTGPYSFTTGINTIASNEYSIAMGGHSEASGWNSRAMGYETIASGQSSTAIGIGTTARSSMEISVGGNNTLYTPNSTTNWNGLDRLFVVGNGPNHYERSNALTIYKNGNIALGNITPSSSTTENVLDVDGRIRLRPKTGSGSTSGIWYSDESGVNRQFAGAKQHNPYWATSRHWGVYIQGWKFWVNGYGDATLTGSLTQNSDKRLKKNITDLSYGLNEVLQLAPKQYFWKDRENQKWASLGLIAQDVQKVITNVVHKGTDKDKTLSLSYTELIPVLINAIKEQQNIIVSQNEKLKKQDTNYTSVLKRLEDLEAKNLQNENIEEAILITYKNKKQ